MTPERLAKIEDEARGASRIAYVKREDVFELVAKARVSTELVKALQYARDKHAEYGSCVNFAMIDAALAKAEGKS